jgi:hypothetical protein
VRIGAVLVGVAACYAPDPPLGAPCSASFECPRGQTCDRTASPPVCGLGPVTDAPPADAAPPVPDGPPGLWGPPALVMPPVGNEDDPTLTSDLLELYFNRDTNDIWRVSRASPTAAWGTPAPVIELGLATTPELAPDGLAIYLGSDRVGTAGSLDIYLATRPDRTATWSTPARVVELCTADTDSNAAVTADQLRMVFARRTGAARGVEVFAASRAAVTAPWSSIATIDVLGSASADGDAILTADELSVYFYSTRTGRGDLYVATRPARDAPFTTPVPIAELNTVDAVEQDPWISPDGRHLFFSSDRTGAFAIYESMR